MLEMTTPVVFIDIVFGLLEGWWTFGDGRKHAVSHQSRWQEVLKSAGFQQILYTDDQRPEHDIERLILAIEPETRYEFESSFLPLWKDTPGSRMPEVPDLSADLLARQTMTESYVHQHIVDWTAPRSTRPFNTSQNERLRMTVLVTGATGSLGAFLVARLIQQPEVQEVVCINRRSR